ncbi:MAG: hypothetical protein ACMZ66_05290 [Thalassospira sp.]|uniref:hypothetical protein n=1 Tax=Thalassospira sp. TaxID=1912094 RepID=UPI003A8501AC
MTDNQSSNARFAPTAWTPKRCALRNSLEGDERKELEQWVMAGNTREIPEKFQAQFEAVKDIKKESKVAEWLMSSMLNKGWARNVIERTWGS